MENIRSDKLDRISEIITIYRKMKRGKNNQSTYRLLTNIGENDIMWDTGLLSTPSVSVIDFCKFRMFQNSKYMFFSEATSLKQWNSSIDDMEKLLNEKYYWINIFNPCEKDLNFLATKYGVHDITLSDIREKNTTEKIDYFKNYTFISMKLFSSCNLDTEDIDFNILIFNNMVITTHDKTWPGILDILNFLYLISQNTKIYPTWVFYSIIVEFLQDVKYILEGIKPETTAQKALSKSINYEMGDTLHDNFEMVYQIYNFRKFIKPKIEILRCFCKSKRHSTRVLKGLFKDCYDDFKIQEKQAKEYNEILERSQDLFLALVDMEQSREANRMNLSMKRFTQITFVFLPLQAIAGLWGMNVKVPWQNENSLIYFWILVCLGPLFNILFYFFRQYSKKSLPNK